MPPRGMTAGIRTGTIGVPDYAAQQRTAQAEIYRKQTEEETRRRQAEITRKEQERMAMDAARNALETQRMLMANSDNPRTTDGTTMTISNYGDVGGSASSRSSRSTGGSGSSTSYAAPAIDTAKIEALLSKYSPSPVAAPVAPPSVAAPAPPTKQADTAKAFANAKNISGRQGAAAVRALHDLMTRRGMSDSGLEAEGESAILGDVLRFNSDAAFRSDLADDERNWEAAQLGYQGALGQRNADMGFLTSGYQGQVQQRGQDLDRLQLALSYLTPRLY